MIYNNITHSWLARILLLSFSTFIAYPGSPSLAQSGQSILVLVNDEPISAFDLEQRLKLKVSRPSPETIEKVKARLRSPGINEKFKEFAMANGATTSEEVQAMIPKFKQQIINEVMNESRGKMRKPALDELIDEKLVIQNAKKLGILDDIDRDVEVRLTEFAGKQKDDETGKTLTLKQFLAHVEKTGISQTHYRNFHRGMTIMQTLIRQKYGLQLQNPLSEAALDQKLASLGADGKGQESTEFLLQKVTLIVSDAKDQKVKAKRLMDAENVRKKFQSCKDTNDLLKEVGGGRVESLGKVAEHQLPKDIKNEITQAKAGQMTAPNMTANGVEFYAVCSRSIIKGNTQKREEIESESRQKQFEVLKKRYIKELRQSAFIEYK